MAAANHNIDALSINTIRVLAGDMVQKSNSGHPGMPMGMAPVAHALWSKAMKFSPSNPQWWNRDRFVLSNGHGCTLQYILLHLAGFKVSMDDLKSFRAIDSITPGHPEVHVTPGIEVTTGPLGQGIGNGVGMAMAAAHLGAVYNKPGFDLFNNHTFVFCGDGCLQEGVASEAASLAGHLKLRNLVIIYDDNSITIDGPTKLSFSEDVPMRFRAYGFNTLTVEKGDDDVAALLAAIDQAKQSDKPTLISVKTTIGFGSTKAGTGKVHGEALGVDDLKHVKRTFGFNPDESFVVPDEVTKYWADVKARGDAAEAEWKKLYDSYAAQFAKESAELETRMAGRLPADLASQLPQFSGSSKADATRNMSGSVLNALADLVPALVGGSADLTPSNKTDLKKSHDFLPGSYDGRYIRFGIREHGMAAIGNGLYAFGGFVPYTATFLNFIEYCFPAVRLAALSNFKQLFIMTHDSIGLGEDGPTHQPIEALQMCRATPNVLVLRPADGAETVGAYVQAVNWQGPSVLALSRQNVTNQAGSTAAAVAKGAYTLVAEDASRPLDLVLVASGTEVTTAVESLKSEQLKGLNVRVVSMPSTTLFDLQSADYRRATLPVGVPTVSVEAAAVFGWEKYAHASIGMTTFGASGPLEKVLDKFHMSVRTLPAAVAQRMQQLQEVAKLNGGKVPALNAHFDFGYPTHHAVSPSASAGGWLRDLTEEGVEPNPGPCAAAGCGCSLTKEDVLEGGVKMFEACLTPGCGHRPGQHTAVETGTAPSSAATIALSELVLLARPGTLLKNVPGLCDVLHRDVEFILALPKFGRDDQVRLVGEQLFKLDQNARTATLHAFSLRNIALLEPLLNTGSSCALFSAVQHGTKPLVVKKLTFADSDRQPLLSEDVGYKKVKDLGLSDKDMVKFHLTPFQLFEAKSPPTSKQTSPAKLVAPATPPRRLASSAPPPGNQLSRTPLQVRPGAAESATAMGGASRQWCWMPRYPVTLEQLGRPMPLIRASIVIDQISIALLKLHSKGLAHMDVKPSNIFVTSDGRLLLGDFGCVRHFNADPREKASTTKAFVPRDMQQLEYEASAVHDWWMLAMTVSDVQLEKSREPGAGASDATREQVRSILHSMDTEAARRLLEQLPVDAGHAAASAVSSSSSSSL